MTSPSTERFETERGGFSASTSSLSASRLRAGRQSIGRLLEHMRQKGAFRFPRPLLLLLETPPPFHQLLLSSLVEETHTERGRSSASVTRLPLKGALAYENGELEEKKREGG